MKTSQAVLPIVFVAALVQFTFAQGMGGLPPGCCSSPLPEEDQDAGEVAEAKMVISDAAVQAMGLTRSQFLDRLADGFFRGRQIYLLASSSTISLHDAYGHDRMPGPIAVQVRRFYRLAKAQVRPEDVDRFNQVYLTDGEVYLDVRFKTAAER